MSTSRWHPACLRAVGTAERREWQRGMGRAEPDLWCLWAPMLYVAYQGPKGCGQQRGGAGGVGATSSEKAQSSVRGTSLEGGDGQPAAGVGGTVLRWRAELAGGQSLRTVGLSSLSGMQEGRCLVSCPISFCVPYLSVLLTG